MKLKFTLEIEALLVERLESRDDTVFTYRLERIIREELRKYGEVADGIDSVHAFETTGMKVK